MSDLHIPFEIREEILHKLPIKSLVRFTCVSKTWLSLIKNPNFTSVSPSNKNPLLLLRYSSKQNKNNYSLYFDQQQEDEEEDEEEYNHYMHLHFPFKNHCFWLVGVINGLVCLDSCTQTIFIWNPSIRKSVTLPKPSITSHRVVFESLGFGFDSHSNDYKVLRLVNRFFGYEVGTEWLDTPEAEIYSLNMNSWRRICVSRGGCEVKYHGRQVFVNGVLHVLAFREVGNDGYRNLMLGCDMSDEVFREIELPQSLAGVNHLCLRLVVYKELIGVFQLVGDVVKHLWVMERYGVVQSWTRKISFHGENGETPTVLGFRRNGELFFQMPDEEIVSCEPNGQVIKHLGVRGSYPSIDYFVESLVLLDNANAQSDQTVEKYAIGNASFIDLVPWVLIASNAIGNASVFDLVPWVIIASFGVLTLWNIWNRRA